MNGSQGPVVGIDLGTTNSVIAAVVQGKPVVLEEDGERILPSIVGFNAQGQLITGLVARNQLAAFPDRTLASVKRHMGTTARLRLGDESFTPQEISAMILRRLKDRATRALGRPVTRAVITVPAFFDESQRQATWEAGELAGFTVERIINEPTAASLVYHVGERDPKRIVVYDFGGGTFDVSIVRMEAGVVEVLTSKGDTHLGGDDLDQLLLDFVAERFLTENQVDLRIQATTRFRLLQSCEQAKRRLSTEDSVQIMEEFIAEKDGRPLHLNLRVTRNEFEQLIRPLVDRTIACVDEALHDVRLTIHQIDDLVLVGGSTRIPLVENRLREEFLREPSRAVDPDLAVALGAAIQAAMIEGEPIGPVLVDVTPHTLGIEACETISVAGPHLVFSPLIHRNSPLPARYEHAYSKLFDDQDYAEIQILQGEHTELKRNRSLGKLKLRLESGGGAKNKVVVRFDLTLNGTLNVTATQVATGISEKLTINNALTQFQEAEREKAVVRLGTLFDASGELLREDTYTVPESQESGHTNSPESADRENLIDDVKLQFPQAFDLIRKAESLKATVAPADAEEMESLCNQLQEAMILKDTLNVTRLSSELDDLLFYVQ